MHTDLLVAKCASQELWKKQKQLCSLSGVFLKKSTYSSWPGNSGGLWSKSVLPGTWSSSFSAFMGEPRCLFAWWKVFSCCGAGGQRFEYLCLTEICQIIQDLVHMFTMGLRSHSSSTLTLALQNDSQMIHKCPLCRQHWPSSLLSPLPWRMHPFHNFSNAQTWQASCG